MSMMKQRGFTLIELMMVVVILAVLLAIAVPAYRDQVLKGNRAVAKAKLLDLAARQEQFIADNKVYSNTLAVFTGLATTDAGVDSNFNWLASNSAERVYTIAVTTTSANMNYVLTATPANAQQADAAKCGSLSITHTGARSATGSLGVECWE